jgi:hypothetical protein
MDIGHEKLEIEAMIGQVGQVPPLNCLHLRMKWESLIIQQLAWNILWLWLYPRKSIFSDYSTMNLIRIHFLCANNEFVKVHFDLPSDQPVNVQFESFASQFQFPNNLNNFVGGFLRRHLPHFV